MGQENEGKASNVPVPVEGQPGKYMIWKSVFDIGTRYIPIKAIGKLPAFCSPSSLNIGTLLEFRARNRPGPLL